MRILAIETIGTTGSVAVLDAQHVVDQRMLDPQLRSARSLAPAIDALLADVGWRPAQIELVAVATGPGSFTGLRIGVTTAKTLAYAVGCQAIGVHTLAAIARQAPDDVAALTVVLDAQRGELYVADFSRPAGSSFAGEASTQVESVDHWLARLNPGTIVSGPGLEKLVERLPQGVRTLDREFWHPTAASVGQLGWQAFAAGQRDSVFDLVPQYYRRTAAEEQWDRKAK